MAKKQTFKQFKDKLLAEMWKRFGLTQNDSRYDTDKAIRSEYEAGVTIDECCEYLQEKDGLDRIDLEPFKTKNTSNKNLSYGVGWQIFFF